MSDTIITLNNRTQPLTIRYSKSMYGFSDSNSNSNRYLFELMINGCFGSQYFKNIEENKYSYLIRLNHMIKLSDITSYKASLSIFPSDEEDMNFELEGIINQDESSSTQRSENMYIEFTQNDMGNTMCCCFYTGADRNKIFASPPV